MTSNRSIRSTLAAAALSASMAASATILTVFDSIPNGTASFNSTVASAGGTVSAMLIPTASSVPSIDAGPFTIARNNGSPFSTSTYGTMSGPVIGINPAGTVRGPAGDSQPSGVTFTFDSPVNSVGFEVGDWGTCCQPSALYISFDGGAPIEVGKSLSTGDVFFGGKSEVFVAAFDDTGSFSTVQFWGDGFGEVLVAGGQLSYALLSQGSLPPPTAVPEPAGVVLSGLVLAGLLMAARRRERG